ncbi:MAG: lipopolysaccharide transport periplasmic protein LptA [Burkholderiales bacterium]|nr:lipopolysaccharide transport periplasmic protein LptA [Burkholderiales bacterium]
MVLGTLCLGAQAERADRDKPVNIEADSVEIDDQKKEAVFIGNVVLTQGTLMLKADRIVVNQDENGFQSGVATGKPGKPATFRQKREGYEDYIEGEAERLEYHGQQEKVELFTNAKLSRGGDEVRGHYISYSALTEFFEVMGSQPGSTGSSGARGRVRAIIQPRNDEEADKKGGSPPSRPDGAGR